MFFLLPLFFFISDLLVCHICIYVVIIWMHGLILMPLSWAEFTESSCLKYIPILFQSGDAKIKFQCGAWCCQCNLVIDWRSLAVNKNGRTAFTDPCLWWPVGYHILLLLLALLFSLFQVCFYLLLAICFGRRQDLATLHMAGCII